MAPIRALACIALFGELFAGSALATQADPFSVLAAFARALQSKDTDAAIGLWSEHGSMVDELGTTLRGKQEVRAFIVANAGWLRLVDFESIEASGQAVRWKQPYQSQDHKRLKVSPVMARAAMRVRDGLIESMVLHFPQGELERIEKACAGSPAIPVMLRGLPCARYLETARAHAENAHGVLSSP